MLKYINENKQKVILGTLATVIIVFYFVYIFRRIDRYLGRMDSAFGDISDVQPLQYNRKVMSGNYKLCDFWIACSYKSYLPCTNYYDYSSPEAIKKAIVYGARYIDLDIMNKTFATCTEPVVCAGDQVGNWHYTTAIPFSACIDVIVRYAFSGKIKNGTDPTSFLI